jgi:hypothetical protein
MVVGRDAYLRRAYENPEYIGFTSGITVMRGNEIVQKEGACLYPQEALVGGWCRVNYKHNNEVATTFKEVNLSEYNTKQSNWNTRPALMISKVAESQALRAAFPTDYAGLYAEEEINPKGNVADGDVVYAYYEEVKEESITQEERQQLFGKARDRFGAAANDTLAGLIAELGLHSTADMPVSVWVSVMERIDEVADEIDEKRDEGAADDDAPPQ